MPGSLNNSRALTTDGRNLFVGGGFLNVLGEGAQQNLVKFAAKTDGGHAPARLPRPTVTSAGGDATVTWTGVMDRDDRDLTYHVLRRGSNTPVASIPADSGLATRRGLRSAFRGSTAIGGVPPIT